MNKTAIKNFAIWARNKLIAEITYKAGLYGITDAGIAPELPASTAEIKFYDIGTKEPVKVEGKEVSMRKSLAAVIERIRKRLNTLLKKLPIHGSTDLLLYVLWK